MASHALRLPVTAPVGRPHPRPTLVRPDHRNRPAPQNLEEATSFSRLLGVAMLGWLGLMAVVMVLAV